MDATVWAVGMAVAISAHFLYRGWKYEESLTSGGGTYATARTESRDGELIDPATVDTVRCRKCGRPNESEYQFCRRCTTPLPEQPFAAPCD
ncbi:hypothetical protein ACFR9U_05885 [Halorientalis brevis]|uniref:DUF7577 domain-containing protein n=1 Tax=Halorientalis brevis TaxID=1126241 RepID=A0ABD6C9L9_9EURY|nr:hypothetical protein [Halorientalis brevis]